MTPTIPAPLVGGPSAARRLTIAGHVVLGCMLFGLTVIGLGSFPVENGVVGGVASIALCGCQLALALRFDRSRALLVVILALSVGLLPVLGEAWLGSFWFAGAAAFLVLPAVAATVVAVALMTTWVVVYARWGAGYDWDLATQAVGALYVLVVGPFGAAALFSLARLPGVVDRLHRAKAAAADQAAERERARVARDLHDLLGQSLSAITLKCGLVERLLTIDRPAAARHLEDLEQIADELAREAGTVAADERPVRLADEAGRAASLLRAAGITTDLDVGVAPLAPAADALFGWAVREGATNVLRHSRASRCTITLAHLGGSTRLEVGNDGTAASADLDGTSNGLSGLAARARALGGHVEAGRSGSDHFQLRVELPGAEP